jgi:hypothetical protein
VTQKFQADIEYLKEILAKINKIITTDNFVAIGYDKTLLSSEWEEALVALRTAALSIAYNRDHATMDEALDLITPLAAKFRKVAGLIRERFENNGEFSPEDIKFLQRVEKIESTRWILAGLLFIMEKDDLSSAVKLITNGGEVSKAISHLGKEEFFWAELVKSINDMEEKEISRVCGALEEIGLLQRFNKGGKRAVRLSAKFHHWVKTQDDAKFLELWKEEAWKKANDIDPEEEELWSSLALGWIIGKGLSPKEAKEFWQRNNWQLL